MASVTTRERLGGFPPVWTRAARRDRRLRLGVPNAGKLRELVGSLVQGAFGCDMLSKQLFFEVNGDLAVLRARSTDLPHLLAQGVVDVAVTGSDYVFESGENLTLVVNLALIVGRICLLTTSGELPPAHRGRRPCISTQYPRHAELFLRTTGIDGEIVCVSGAGELYPRIGVSDASVDCVVTGRTARENDLRIASIIRPVTTGIYVRTPDTDQPAITGYRQVAERLREALGRASGEPEGTRLS